MGVTQYTGARYVPLFAEPAEWNNTRTYEPLTIVIHEGNSYTSRQYVPKGIDIANEKFWALTGNYNAQVELYRKSVAAIDSLVTGTVVPAVNQNSTDIATNKSDIATNKSDIATNKSDIATNKSDIATNKSDIATNKADIATNKADIATNKADIVALSNITQDSLIFDTRNAAANSEYNFESGNIFYVNRYAADKPFSLCCFIVNSDSSTDYGTTITLKNGAFAHINAIDGVIRPEWFGADYNSDATSAIQNAIEFAYNLDSPTIYFGNNIFETGSLTVNSGVNGMTFAGATCDVHDVKCGLKYTKNNGSLITISSEDNSNNYCYGINFKNIVLSGIASRTGITTGIEMHGCVRGYITHTQISFFDNGIYGDNLWDYAIDDVNVYNCGDGTDNTAGMILTSNTKHMDNSNAVHVTNSHFETNTTHLQIIAGSDNQFTNCKFEGGSTTTRTIFVSNKFNNNINIGNNFINCFMSCGTTGNNANGLLDMQGNSCVVNGCSFIGNFANNNPVYFSGVENLFTNNTIVSFSTFRDDYALQAVNGLSLHIANNTFRCYSKQNAKVKIASNTTTLTNNIYGPMSSPSQMDTTVDFIAGSNNVVNENCSLVGGFIPFFDATINGITAKKVSGDVVFDGSINYGNYLVCTADANITYSANKAYGNNGVVTVLANGHSYKFNGTSYNENNTFVSIGSTWYVV